MIQAKASTVGALMDNKYTSKYSADENRKKQEEINSLSIDPLTLFYAKLKNVKEVHRRDMNKLYERFSLKLETGNTPRRRRMS